MTPAIFARASWAVLALPLALVAVFVSLAMWPLVLQNNTPRLALIVYVIACPLLPLFWRGSRLAYLVPAAVAALIGQIAAFGLINFWF